MKNVKKPLIYLVAGEASGDQIGARLMGALRQKRDGQVSFSGVGGPLMAAEGLSSLFPMSELSIMGLVEVIPHIPNVLSRLRQTTDDILKQRPDVVVTIDSPGFCFRLAKKLRGRGIPVVHYTAPTVWAWRPERAQKMVPNFDHLLALFPFEPPYFERVGLPCTFVGHPLIEKGIDTADGLAFRKRHKIPASSPLICLLPGSRRQEIQTLFPLFLEAVKVLKARFPDLYCVLPTSLHRKELIDREIVNLGVPDFPLLVVTEESEKFQAMGASQGSLAASGTVALELALAGTPMVIGYKVSKLTEWILRRLVMVSNVCLVNLITKKDVVLELLQDDCRPDRLAESLGDLLAGGERAEAQKKAFKEVTKALKGSGESPSAQAADVILKFLR